MSLGMFCEGTPPQPAISEAILAVLQGDKEYRPSELLEALREQHLAESDIKEAVAYLLRDHQVEMTPDRRLRAPAGAHA